MFAGIKGSGEAFKGYRCESCGSIVGMEHPTCPEDGGLLLAEYDMNAVDLAIRESLASQEGIWRFSPVLPPVGQPITRGEGGTPIHASIKWGNSLGVALYFKDEGANPSGSFKDRGVAAMFSGLSHDVTTVVVFSSGNAASSVALYAAATGVHAVVLMYQGGTTEKTFMTQAFGASVVSITADREGDVYHLSQEVAHRMGWNLMNTSAIGNPLLIEGYKTLAYELAAQVENLDVVVVPTASGALLSGIWKGFRELRSARILNQVPRIIGVQPSGSAPIANAFKRGLHVAPRLDSVPRTIASALTFDDPGASGQLTLKAVRESEGAMISVEDDELLAAARALGREEALLVEPAGAASLAGVIGGVEDGIIRRGETVACVVTGHGLKDVATVRSLHSPPAAIPANVDRFMDVYEAQKETGLTEAGRHSNDC